MDYLIRWPQLTEGRIIKRYKRFLADIELADGQIVTAHCPNSGRMTGCWEAGCPVWLSESDNPKRKLRYTLEMTQMPESRIVVNTLMANHVARAAIEAGQIRELGSYDKIRSEVKYGQNSRIDLLLGEDCYVEVKSCTLVEGGMGLFPDAPSERGRKHLTELINEVKAGNRAVMLFLIQRMDASSFRAAAMIDPAYAEGLNEAHAAGVEVLAYDTIIDLNGIALNKQIPVII